MLFLSSSVKKDEADSTVQFQQCIKILADKVTFLTRQSAELLDRYSAVQAAHGAIAKDLDEKKELIKNLYNKLQLEKQVCLVTYAVTNLVSFTVLHNMNTHAQKKTHLEYARRMNSLSYYDPI
jgi:hypothetical protein